MPQQVTFKLITPDVAIKLLQDYQETGDPFIFYSMEETSYLNLSLWLTDVKTHIKDLDSEIGLARSQLELE